MTRAQQLEPLYTFAVHMLGAREQALALVQDVVKQHPDEPESWLPALVQPFLTRRKGPRPDYFAELDDILRTNTTIPVDLEHPLVRGEVRRLNILLAELKRTCLLTTLRGVTAERRAVFILRHVLGLSVEACAAACGTTINAIAVADARGRQDLERYLSLRCEHMDARNPCRCPARLGNALDRGLVSWPDPLEAAGDPASERTFSRISDLYSSLPRVRLPVLIDG